MFLPMCMIGTTFSIFSSGWRSRLQFLIAKSVASLPHLAYQTFSVAVFFLQFLQWFSTYNENEGETQNINEAQEIPAPKANCVRAICIAFWGKFYCMCN
mgnify:FL=1